MIPNSRYQKSLSILSDRQQQQLSNQPQQQQQQQQQQPQQQQQQQQQDHYSTLSSQHQNLSLNQQQANITNLSLLSQLQQNVGHHNQQQQNQNLAGLFSNHTLLHQPSSSQNSASSQATTLGHHHHLNQHLNTHNQQHFSLHNQQPTHHLSHHHLHQLQQQQQQQQQHYFNPATNHNHLLNQNRSQGSQHSNGSASTATTTANQQAGAYNLNNSSDYSSSTYHVYDQILGDQIIDDLIVIKQERMKKKHEQEQRRKVILFSLAVILLVGLLMFLIVQLLKATSPAGGGLMAGSQLTQQPVTFAYPTSSLPRMEPTSTNSQQNDPPTSQNNDNNNNNNNFDGSFTPSGNTRWTPPSVAQPNNNWQFDPSKFSRQQQPIFRPVMPNGNNNNNNPVILQQQPNTRPFLVIQQQQQPPFNMQPVAPQPPLMPPPQVQFPPVSVMMSSTTQQPLLHPAAASSEPPQKPQVSSLQTTPQPMVQQPQQQHQQPPQGPPQSPTTTILNANSDSNNLRGCHGKHCNPTTGCPNQCSGRGQCVKSTGPTSSSSSSSQQADSTNLWLVQHQHQQPEWHCQCPPGTTGDDCGILLERQCNDGLDNDNDGLVDCADSECCSDLVCQNSTLCTKSPDPLDILMRKPPLPPTSSFFQRMQFLIEKFSSQFYTNAKDFNDSRASVIRGRVIYQKQGVTGVRVSIAGQINLGVTFTRDGGYFDLMVNGGGAVVVEFMREPFATLKKTIRVPWNEIVLMDSIELQLSSISQNDNNSHQSVSPHETDAPTCSAHNYRLLMPQIVAAPRSISSATSRRQAPAVARHQAGARHQGPRAVILRDSAMVQQSINLPQSSSTSSQQANDSVSIVYISSRAREFMSTINIQLTPPASSQDSTSAQQQLSEELKQVHLKIVIEGILFEQTFEPQLNLSFTYAWNRQNVYRQKSFGLSTATVSVGYEYTDCKHIIWSTKQLQLAGHDLAISDIGAQWNLNIHHRYNYRDSILQRGDGQNFQLKTDKPRVVRPVMGDGYPRQANCPFCDGASSPAEQKLLRPQALVFAPDGSLYVGDFNMIRRIEPLPASTQGGGGASTSAASNSAERIVRTVLEMPAGSSSAPLEYALALNLTPSEAPQLYMADPHRRQVYLVKEHRNSQGNSAADASNETTPPTSQSGSSSELLDNLVPIAGTGEHCSPDDQQSCDDGHAASAARLIEPRAIAFDLAGRMYIADGPNVRLVDLDQKIYTILGDYLATAALSNQRQNLVQLHHHHHQQQQQQQQQQQLRSFPCGFGEAVPMHKFAPKAPQDLAFNPIDETLHLLDDNVIYKITQDKRILVVAGRPAHCQQVDGPTSRSLGQGQQLKATQVTLLAARSIAFNQHGDLFIGEDDQAAQTGRVLVVSPVDDTVALYAGQQLASSEQQDQVLGKSRASNALLPTGPSSGGGQSAPMALDYKLNSVGAIALDQQGNLLVADRQQLRVLSIEPDLPQLNAQGEYEIQSLEQPDELLVFNRHGLHVATRELLLDQLGHQVSSSAQQQQAQQRGHNKYTFAYNVNTSYGQLASVSYTNGNKISIYRDGPHHSVKMIETAFGGQCKLEVSRNGQVHSISTVGPGQTKTSMAYYVDGGLLRQSRDQVTDELFNFVYDEFGRATAIQRQSPRLPAPVECRLQQADQYSSTRMASTYLGQQCSALIVAE